LLELDLETVDTVRLAERRWSSLRMLVMLNLFQEAAEAPSTIREQ
jgi:hypothetical protein